MLRFQEFQIKYQENGSTPSAVFQTGTLSLIFECKNAEKSITQVANGGQFGGKITSFSLGRVDNIVVIVRRTSCSSGLVLGKNELKVSLD